MSADISTTLQRIRLERSFAYSLQCSSRSAATGEAADRTPVSVGAVTVSLQDASFDFITANYVAINNDIVNTQLVAMGTVGLAADSGDASALLGRVQPFLPYIVGGTPTITPGGDNNFVITLVLKRKLIDYILDHVNLYLVIFGPLNTHKERKRKDNGLNN